MRIIPKDRIIDILKELGKKYRPFCDDDELNILSRMNQFMHFNEEDIIRILKVDLEEVLYSKYYWFTELKKRHDEIYGLDSGIDQRQYKILEEIDQRIPGSVDWDLIQAIEKEIMG